MPTVKTDGELNQLIDEIAAGRGHFVGYEPPYAMIAIGSEIFEAPIGHVIPALMKSLADHRKAADGEPTFILPSD